MKRDGIGGQGRDKDRGRDSDGNRHKDRVKIQRQRQGQGRSETGEGSLRCSGPSPVHFLLGVTPITSSHSLPARAGRNRFALNVGCRNEGGYCSNKQSQFSHTLLPTPQRPHRVPRQTTTSAHCLSAAPRPPGSPIPIRLGVLVIPKLYNELCHRFLCAQLCLLRGCLLPLQSSGTLLRLLQVLIPWRTLR